MSNTDTRTSIEEIFDKWIEDYGVELDTEAEHALRYGVVPEVDMLMHQERTDLAHHLISKSYLSDSRMNEQVVPLEVALREITKDMK